jgi:hypothetical protein
MRTGARWLARGVLALLAFALLFPPLWAAATHEDVPPPRDLASLPATGDDRRPYRVWVADWGYHTSIVVEQPASWRLGPPGREAAPFVEWAWGDRRFYRDSDFRPHAVYATLVIPTATVVYLAGRDEPPSTSRGARGVWSRTVDEATLRRLVAELERTIRRDDAGVRLAPAPPVAGYAGRFHDAHGRYTWARDCNWWTAERLARVGLASGASGVVFPGQVAPRLRAFAPEGGAPAP